jgi:hypothetical protein
LSHLSGSTNSSLDHEVRLALQPLVDLSHRTGCLVLGSGNFRKDKSLGARAAASSSGAFMNTPRVGLAMAYDDQDSDVRIVEVVKSNAGPKNVGRNYRLKTTEIPELTDPQPYLVADGAAWKRVDDLLVATKNKKRVSGAQVRELILRELASGRKFRNYLDDVAMRELDASSNTVYQSGFIPLRDEGRVRAGQTTDGWFWELVGEHQETA